MKAVSEHLVFNRPFPIRALNSLGSSLGINSPKLNADKIFSTAVKQAAASELRLEEYKELQSTLKLLCKELEHTAKLNQTGRILTYFSLINTVKNRLEVDKWCKQHPELPEQKIESPVFILGLPRTGTTALFNMLADLPNFRAPLGWEVNKPIPPVKYSERYSDPRISATQKEFNAFYYLTPKLRLIHEFGAQIPQECIAFTNYELYSIHNFVSYHIPAYVDWYEKNKLDSVFAFHKKFLQCLQSDFPAQTWLLKTPAHLSAIDQIFETYPDARIIQTHRNPMDVMGSLCSFSWHLRSTFSDEIDCCQIGNEQLELWSKALNKAMDSRQKFIEKQHQIIDVSYTDFVTDPVAQVKQITQKLGLNSNDKIQETLTSHSQSNQKDRYGKHSYDLKDFGLDKERDSGLFADYCQQFNLNP